MKVGGFGFDEETADGVAVKGNRLLVSAETRGKEGRSR